MTDLQFIVFVVKTKWKGVHLYFDSENKTRKGEMKRQRRSQGFQHQECDGEKSWVRGWRTEKRLTSDNRLSLKNHIALTLSLPRSD